MTIFFNNSATCTDHSTLEGVLQEQSLLGRKGIAVAVNEEVIQQSKWTTTTISENDKILIITATQGG